MNTNFIKFLKFTLTDSKYDELISQINDIDNLTVRDLKLISDTCNREYKDIVDMYLDGHSRLHNERFIKEAIKNHDIDALRRVILDRHILVASDKVYLAPTANKFRYTELSQDVYQDLLKVLIEANEIGLAHRISFGSNYYKDFNSNIANIEEYICGKTYEREDFSCEGFLVDIYNDLEPNRKKRVHDRVMNGIKANYEIYLKLKDSGYRQKLNSCLMFMIKDTDREYHDEYIEIPDVYKLFSPEEQAQIRAMFNLEEE